MPQNWSFCCQMQNQDVTEEVNSLFLGTVNKTETENEATVNGREAKDGTVTENETTVDKVITDIEPPWHTTLVICRTAVRFHIDSGANTTIINEATYKLPLRRAKTQTCHY